MLLFRQENEHSVANQVMSVNNLKHSPSETSCKQDLEILRLESCKGMNFATLPYCFFPYPSPILPYAGRTLARSYPT